MKGFPGHRLRDAFAGTTSLTIAHRLETIIDSDAIVTMADGRVAEYAPVADLLDDPASRLNALLDAVDADRRAVLVQRARARRSGSL